MPGTTPHDGKVRYVAFTANEIAALRLALPELTPSHIALDALIVQSFGEKLEARGLEINGDHDDSKRCNHLRPDCDHTDK
jgi:hypothetical protein